MGISSTSFPKGSWDDYLSGFPEPGTSIIIDDDWKIIIGYDCPIYRVIYFYYQKLDNTIGLQVVVDVRDLMFHREKALRFCFKKALRQRLREIREAKSLLGQGYY